MVGHVTHTTHALNHPSIHLSIAYSLSFWYLYWFLLRGSGILFIGPGVCSRRSVNRSPKLQPSNDEKKALCKFCHRKAHDQIPQYPNIYIRHVGIELV